MTAMIRIAAALGLFSMSLGLVAGAGAQAHAAGAPAAVRQSDAESAQAEAARLRAIVEEAYIYGLPLVMNYAVMYSYAVDKASPEYKSAFNQLAHARGVLSHRDRVVVTPNSDTPYSFAWLDLRAEPQVITLPAVEANRYISLQVVDGNTYNQGFAGTRTTGNDGARVQIAGPAWRGETPVGIERVIRATTPFAMALLRTQLFAPDDIARVNQIQDGYRVEALSSYLLAAAPPAAPALAFPPIEKQLAQRNFFAYLDFALRLAPAGEEEQGIRQRLASIGIGNGRFDDFTALATRQRAAVLAGVALAERQIDRAVAALGANRNGWRMAGDFVGKREAYAGDWLKRAAVARAGIYALDAAEAIYAMTRVDAGGQPLDGGAARYTLRFAPGQLPPVDYFWSVTMYDGRDQFLVDNPLQRYLINSPQLPQLQRDADGGVTLHIQHASPGKARESNWLPAPDGPIFMVLRLYGPQPSVLAGRWQPPAVERVGAR